MCTRLLPAAVHPFSTLHSDAGINSLLLDAVTAVCACVQERSSACLTHALIGKVSIASGGEGSYLARHDEHS